MFTGLLLVLISADASLTTTLPSVSECRKRSTCTSGHADIDNRNCYCDKLCRQFEDCCSDYDIANHQVNVDLPKELISCERLEDRYDEVYVVSRCPESFTDESVRSRCMWLPSSENVADMFFRVPVISRSTDNTLIFRNVYCAACFGDASAPIFWNVQLICSRIPSSAEDISLYCSVADVLSPPGSPVRRCKTHVSRCDRQWSDVATSERCQHGEVSYVYAGNRAFRNVFCASCNFVNRTYLSCIDSRHATERRRNTNDVVAIVTLDLNSGRWTITKRGETAQELVKEFPNCRHLDGKLHQHYHVFDPFARRCRRINFSDTDAIVFDMPYSNTSVILINSTEAESNWSTYRLHVIDSPSARIVAELAAGLSAVLIVVAGAVIVHRSRLRQKYCIIFLCLFVCLFVQQFLYVLVGPLVDLVVSHQSHVCFFLSVFEQYSTIMCLCWINAFAIEIYRHRRLCGYQTETVDGENERCRLILYSLFAVLTPMSSVGVNVVISLLGVDGGTDMTCFSLGISQLLIHGITIVILLVCGLIHNIRFIYHRVDVMSRCIVQILLTLVVGCEAFLTLIAAVTSNQPAEFVSIVLHATVGPVCACWTFCYKIPTKR